jgi:cobyrinic acid a,c-diamide synthase
VGERCRALMVSAPASGQGKTTVTAALARRWTRQGLRVRVFKTGPDFLDPMIHARASGQPCWQLDLWMGGEAHCRRLLAEAAQDHDIVLVEGVMGLFDGRPSSADLAQTFGLPVLAVIEAAAMAQTFGALALGLQQYRPGLPVSGVLANRVGSPGHAEMLRESLPPGLAWYGALPREAGFELPSRHLGLVQAAELADLDARLDRAADALAALDLPLPPEVDWGRPEPDVDELAVRTGRCAASAWPSRGTRPSPSSTRPMCSCCSAWARPASSRPWPTSRCPRAPPPSTCPAATPSCTPPPWPRPGARAAACRPTTPPACPGGRMRRHAGPGRGADRRPGHLPCRLGLLPGEARMSPRLVNLGLHAAELPEGTVRGHTFHHARFESPLPRWPTPRPNATTASPRRSTARAACRPASCTPTSQRPGGGGALVLGLSPGGPGGRGASIHSADRVRVPPP